MIELEEDIESDLSVLHRIDSEEIEGMESARFFRLAERLGTYQGAVAARVAALRAERDQQQTTGGNAPARPAPARPAAPVETAVRPQLWTRTEVPIGGTS